MRVLFALLMLTGVCAVDAQAQGPRLGPTDTQAFPPTDFERVAVGTKAPDFVLESQDGSLVKLSQFRGKQNVVLVFYRGFW